MPNAVPIDTSNVHLRNYGIPANRRFSGIWNLRGDFEEYAPLLPVRSNSVAKLITSVRIVQVINYYEYSNPILFRQLKRMKKNLINKTKLKTKIN